MVMSNVLRQLNLNQKMYSRPNNVDLSSKKRLLFFKGRSKEDRYLVKRLLGDLFSSLPPEMAHHFIERCVNKWDRTAP